MIGAPWQYYIIPIICAASGAMFAATGQGRRRVAANVALCIFVAAVAAVVELLMHESPRIGILDRPTVVLAMTLSLLVPALAGLVGFSLGQRANWPRAVRVVTFTLTVSLALAFSPLCTLYLVCYIGHDCI
jgi:hypothetical protein